MIDANEALLNSYAGSRGRGGVNNKSYFVFLSFRCYDSWDSFVQQKSLNLQTLSQKVVSDLE